MLACSCRWTSADSWIPSLDSLGFEPNLILYFGAPELLAAKEGALAGMLARFPSAVSAGVSTAGEIQGASVTDHSLSVLAIRLEHSEVRGAKVKLSGPEQCTQAGEELGRQLAGEGLRHVLVFCDGLLANGSQLTRALSASLPAGVCGTGGLAADGAKFRTTYVGLGTDITSGQIVALGFYGEAFRVVHGYAGGWQPFGPKRLITRSKGNILYSLDGQEALGLYKRYLGDRAAGLPATGLLFPLQLLSSAGAETGIVRTILAVDEADQALIFAGDIPEGHYVRLMRAGCDALVEGAQQAAVSAGTLDCSGTKAAVLVSCVGRKLVMGQRVEEEVEAVLRELGPGVEAAGFYSYGEIAPSVRAASCELHNQTMTLTVFGEQTS